MNYFGFWILMTFIGSASGVEIEQRLDFAYATKYECEIERYNVVQAFMTEFTDEFEIIEWEVSECEEAFNE